MFYVICGLYYTAEMYDGKEVFYGKQHFLGIDDEEIRVFIYEDKITDKTLRFSTMEDAEKYMNSHCTESICCERHFVLKVEEM